VGNGGQDAQSATRPFVLPAVVAVTFALIDELS